MESIRVQRLMKSVFAFRQQYILLGLLPARLLWTHMEVICQNSLAEKEKTGGHSWDFGAKNHFEGFGVDVLGF